MTDFSSLGLAEDLLRAVSDEGFTTPTPIQAGVIPKLLGGQDVVGIAQTGTGKTAAFVLPLLDAHVRGTLQRAPKTCGALILAPTRELAAQIADSVKTLGRNTKLRVAVVVGGARPGPQIKALAGGVDILVATPGRLLDHMTTGAISLGQTKAVVLDEADQMFDLGFFPAIRRIMGRLPKDRQTVLLSATMPPPIRKLADEFLTEPAEVSVSPQSRPVERIDQSVIHLDRSEKMAKLTDLLSDTTIDRAIVFTKTKRGADRVSRNLEKSGFNSGAIHGNKSQNQRTRILDAFREGKVSILVATDIAARGIDIDDVSHVFNYELPNVPEAYVHRIGRTARAGRSGAAVSLCDPEERSLLRDIERLIGARLASDGKPAPEMPPASSPRRDGPPAGSRGNRSRSSGAKPGGSGSSGPRTGQARPSQPRSADPRKAGRSGERRDTGRGAQAKGSGLDRKAQGKSAPRRTGGSDHGRGGSNGSRPKADGFVPTEAPETGLNRMLGISARG
ncbi:MAG: DEAD/DEAH box helicase [Alphaproteobacteria bacterium]